MVDLAGFASATALGSIALGIGVGSVMRFFKPMEVAFLDATFVAGPGLAVNVASVSSALDATDLPLKDTISCDR